MDGAPAVALPRPGHPIRAVGRVAQLLRPTGDAGAVSTAGRSRGSPVKPTLIAPGFSPALALELSTENLLLAGGDSRLRLDPLSQLNKYGCAPRPRPHVLALGSCTASSVSTIGFEAAARIHERLQGADCSRGGLDYTLECVYEEIRARLLDLLLPGDPGAAEVVLTPSGTDAEFVALALALGDRTRALCNVVVGPSEVGSGTPLAASALHFDARVPAGFSRVVGESIDRLCAAQVSLATVGLRDERGRARPPEAIDAEVEQTVSRAIDQGRRVLLHVVAHSKTGVHAPTLAAVARMRARHGDTVRVLVDAAQGRLSRRGLREALGRDHMVLVTGSKFYGGPPFAGALLVPPRLQPEQVGLHRWPRSFGEYFTAGQLPPRWPWLRASLPPTGNVGLVLRWCAALAEMHAFYDVPSGLRSRALRAFESLIPEIFGQSPSISLLPVSPPLFSDRTQRLLESNTTVFPFFLMRDRRARPRRLNHAALGKVFRWLNGDVSRLLPGANRRDCDALKGAFQIGQPVEIGSDGMGDVSVLRIALGGPLIVQMVTDPALGAEFSNRVEWLARELRRLRRKLELIANNFDIMEDREQCPQTLRTGT